MAIPITGFQDFKFNSQVLKAIQEAGYITPTPIQQKVIPQVLAGHDLLGIAPTGTGKTAAFLLPVIMKLGYAQDMHTRVLILSPTRELAIQTGNEAKKLSTYCGLRIVTIYGGTGTKSQIESINKGVDIIVATPGRFTEIYRSGNIVTKFIKILIIDEADRMMDMGFMPQIRSILEVIPVRKRQNLLFSATFPEKVEGFSSEFLEFPVRIEISPQATPANTIEQLVYKVPNLKTKINLLEYFLGKPLEYEKVIVFAKTKKSATAIFKFIERKIDKNARVIHSNKDQNARLNAINDFSSGKVKILVSTDIAARGLDISLVSHVINFDMPVKVDDYVHRIGRTGRAGQKGIAITFINRPDEYHLAEAEKLIRNRIQVSEIPEEVEIAETPREELQEQARDVDNIRKKADPGFKGAFHDKKEKNKPFLKKGRKK
jgi:ATP-dependent RNA helicase RhlE